MNQIQSRILAIFHEFQEICDAHGFSYFAIGGTAIGAVRHSGFIPWDDDLDIAMPIEDFVRFCSMSDNLLPDWMALVGPRTDKSYVNVFAKLVDVNSTFLEEPLESEGAPLFKGVWIDIMPMCGVPEDTVRQKQFIGRLRRLYSLNAKRRFSFSSMNGVKSKIAWLVFLPTRLFFWANFSDRYLRLLRAHEFGDAGMVGYTWSAWNLPRLIFPKEWFSDYVLMPFEDTQIRMPVGYHKYLTQQFGDYMTVPPPDQQITHRGFIDLDHSYRDYQSGKLRIPEGYFDRR